MLQASPFSRPTTGPRRDEKMLKPFAETDNYQCLMRCTPMSDEDRDNPRREFLRKSLTLIPVVTLAGTGLGSGHQVAATQHRRNGLLLDRSRRAVTSISNRL